MSDKANRWLKANKPECDNCTFKFNPKDDCSPKCMAINYHTDSNVCRFFKDDKKMRIELKRCYIRANNPFYRSFNDYLEMLNIQLQTTFYDKYKDGIYNGKD